jgi:hypothetical protein
MWRALPRNKGGFMKAFLLKFEDNREEVHTALKIIAAQEGKTMQELMHDIIDSYLEK